MGRKARVRLLSKIGSTTGVATAVLALLSAGTVASITLVGVHQLASTLPDRVRASEPSSVRAPEAVVVTPRVAPVAPGSESVSHRRTSKQRKASSSPVAVVHAAVTSAVARVPAPTPRVTRPRVHVDRPAAATPVVTVPTVTTPAVTTPAVTTPAVITAVAAGPPVATPPAPSLSLVPSAVNAPPVPGYPNVARTERHRSSGLDADAPSPQAAVAVLGEKHSSKRAGGDACGEQAGGDHRDGYGDDRDSRNGSGGYGDDRGRGHASGDSRHDRHERRGH